MSITEPRSAARPPDARRRIFVGVAHRLRVSPPDRGSSLWGRRGRAGAVDRHVAQEVPAVVLPCLGGVAPVGSYLRSLPVAPAWVPVADGLISVLGGSAALLPLPHLLDFFFLQRSLIWLFYVLLAVRGSLLLDTLLQLRNGGLTDRSSLTSRSVTSAASRSLGSALQACCGVPARYRPLPRSRAAAGSILVLSRAGLGRWSTAFSCRMLRRTSIALGELRGLGGRAFKRKNEDATPKDDRPAAVAHEPKLRPLSCLDQALHGIRCRANIGYVAPWRSAPCSAHLARSCRFRTLKRTAKAGMNRMSAPRPPVARPAVLFAR